jgi:hypothetical protein
VNFKRQFPNLRSVAFVMSGVCTLVLAIMPLIITPNVWVVLAVGALGVLALVALVVADELRAVQQQAQMAKLLDAITVPAPAVGGSTTLRAAALDLVADMRALLAQPGADDNADGEWAMSHEFVTRFYARLRAIKERLENVLGRNAVESAGRRLPIGYRNISRIVNQLEREAVNTPPDVPAGL